MKISNLNLFILIPIIINSCSLNTTNTYHKTNLIKQNENTYNFYYDGNTSAEKNNLKLKLNYDNLFNTKYSLRKTISDISKIEISFCNSVNNCSNFMVNYDGTSNLKNITVNIKNLAPDTYYARVTAKDSSNNILNKNVSGYDQSNNVTVDSTYAIPFNSFLNVNLFLKDSVRSTNQVILNTESQINYSNIIVNEKGDGLVYWLVNLNTIKVQVLKEYFPIGSVQSFSGGSDNVNSLSASWFGKDGIVVYSKTSGGMSYLVSRKISLKPDNTLDIMSENIIETFSGTNSYKDIYMKLDNTGTGSLVCSKFDGLLKYNIYTLKFDYYVNSSLTPFFTDNKSDKTNPVISTDNNGKGVIIWQNDFSGIKELVLSKVINFKDYDNGKLSASNSTIVTGLNTTFTTDFPTNQQSIKVENIINPLGVSTVTDDLNLVLTTSQNLSGAKYAVIISEVNSFNDFAPNVVTNNSGTGLVVWKSNDSGGSIKALKLNNFNLLGSTLDNVLAASGANQDTNKIGLSLNSDGNGLLTFTSGSISRQLLTSNISSYIINTSFNSINTDNNLLGPNVSLNNTGSGILTYSYGSSFENMAFRHIKEYNP